MENTSQNLTNRKPEVYWHMLLERNVNGQAVGPLIDAAMQAGADGYHHLHWPYSRTDIARNFLVGQFRKLAKSPDDVLVMLDNDHIHPPDVLRRLVRHNEGVVGALCFRRGTPYFPCMFQRWTDGGLHIALEYDKGLVQCTLVGTGAIAIRRWVFDKLEEAGYGWPFFRYLYPPGDEVLPSEDIYFGNICEKAGIPHHCDTELVCPHLTDGFVDESSWRGFVEDHPEMTKPEFDWNRVYHPAKDLEESAQP